MKRKKNPGSFRFGLMLATLLCWILPIIIVTLTAGMIINRNYNQNLKQAVDADINSAMRQVELRLESVIEDSKSVSYDGIVRQAYRDFQQNPVEFPVYRSVTDYLSQKFSRSANYKAVFISFTEDELDITANVTAPGVAKTRLINKYTNDVYYAAHNILTQQDTGIFFMEFDGELYMIRNLLDNDFRPYAMLVMELDCNEVFRSLYSLKDIQTIQLSIDGTIVPLEIGSEEAAQLSEGTDLAVVSEVDGHELNCGGNVRTMNIWNTVPLLRWAILFILSMVIPLFFIILFLFRRNLNHPMEVLIDANAHVQAGERGFRINEEAPNTEFTQLYSHFNSMSAELKSQFEQLYQEQQALQQAKIKALQSQINPHFLNNTLEIINWEARLADNERVCSMIEALSIMLDAAINRDGRSRVPLSEELRYVDAYLYITQERLGDRLTIKREIDPETLEDTVPLLMLQPIIENAIEHDLSRAGGQIDIRIFRSEGRLVLEVEHDGHISEEGWQNIRRSLAAAEPDEAEKIKLRSGGVGIRNVYSRLKLLYGENCSFDISEAAPGKILARIEIALPQQA